MGLKRTEPFPHTPPAPRKEVKTGKKETDAQTETQRGKDTGQEEQEKTDSWGRGLTAHTRATRGTLICSYESNAREVSVKKK